MNDDRTEFTGLLARLRQDPLAVAREAAAAGRRVVGYVGDGVPVALIVAAGALPVRLRADFGDAERAAEFIEPSFAPELRAIADLWLRGAFDALEAVIFSRADDSGQRLYYYLCELQRRGLCRGPRPLLYDVASLPRGESAEHTLASTRILAEELGAAPDRLDSGLRRVRAREALLHEVGERQRLPAPLPGSVAWSLERAAAADWRESFDELAHRWLATAPLLEIPTRILLAGDPPPDDQLHVAIEACGASVVLELTGSTRAGERTQRSPLSAIAEEFQQLESPALSMRRSARWLADRALDVRAAAAVLWLSEQNEALPWEIVRQVRSLEDARIPTLLLARQPGRVSAAVLTQLLHFVRGHGRNR